ncbi:hypothetical protein BKA63DRAFT_567983 [Paraphoma chrysanthemicola]|nr:hypothetical protein BKA63DRAFT_567983 [Paraphoma chrysanthemicola]
MEQDFPNDVKRISYEELAVIMCLLQPAARAIIFRRVRELNRQPLIMLFQHQHVELDMFEQLGIHMWDTLDFYVVLENYEGVGIPFSDRVTASLTESLLRPLSPHYKDNEKELKRPKFIDGDASNMAYWTMYAVLAGVMEAANEYSGADLNVPMYNRVKFPAPRLDIHATCPYPPADYRLVSACVDKSSRGRLRTLGLAYMKAARVREVIAFMFPLNARTWAAKKSKSCVLLQPGQCSIPPTGCLGARHIFTVRAERLQNADSIESDT